MGLKRIIWHDEDCPGYECACTTHPRKDSWCSDELGTIYVWGSTKATMLYYSQEDKIIESELIDKYGPDFGVGTILSFFKMFSGNIFTYVAVRTENLWYITGQTSRYTWSELIQFILDSEFEDPMSTIMIYDEGSVLYE